MSQSTSSSSSSPVQTPENDIMNQISATASGMASNLFNWAQGVYAKTSAITDQAVGNFFQVSQQMMGLSNNMINQYNSLFAPENAQLVADANSYASPARMAADMGMAGATAAQAGQAAEANSASQLQSFGIDPSAGRYAGLLNADNVQNAANVAGAENQQRVADTQMGQTLRAEAVQTGAQLPSSIANVENTGIQANTGAVNAELANANTGVNLMGLPNNYLQTAMGVKMPFSAQTSKSQSTGSVGGSGSGSGSGGKQSGGDSGSGGAFGGGSGAPSAYNASAMGGAGSPYGGAPGMQTTNFGTSGSAKDWGANVNSDALGGVNASDFTGGFQNFDQNPWNADQMYNPGNSFDNFNTFNGQGGGATAWDQSQNQMGDTSGMFGGSWNDPSNSWDGGSGQFGNPTDTSLGGFDPTQGGGGYNTTTPQWSDSTITDYSNYGASGGGGGGGSYGDTTSNYDPNAYSGDSGYTDNGGGDSYFAKGGAVPAHMRTPPKYHMPNMMANGGQVPAQASPSGGQKVDDVRAQGPGQAPMRLNANEFVIPQDVALWKGQEFFQNMINDSRKKRMSPGGAPAKPTVKPMGGQ